MQGKLKKLKDSQGNYAYPITVGDAVYVESSKTLTQKLNEIGSSSGGTSSVSYPYYVATEEDGAESPTNQVYKNWTLDELYGMYDNLVAQYPKYIRKEVASYKDMSGQYELRRYVFEPEYGYDKTIYISAGVHGNEMAGKLGLARICQLVCGSWKTNSFLNYLRNNVRMVIIPVVNPWGHVNKTMTNSNSSANGGNTTGVNCNRNYDGYWGQTVTSAGAEHNGASPFSENETKWIRDTINYYGAENFHYGFDFHDAGTASVQGDFWINHNTFHTTSAKVTRRLVWYLARKWITTREPYIWHDKDTTTGGVFPVWAGRVMGIPSSTVENCYEGGSGVAFDKAFMTKSVETYLNAVLVNTLAEHKSPVISSNSNWFNVEWFKAAGEYAINSVSATTFSTCISLWNNLTTKYPNYAKKSDTYVTSSDGNQVYHYILAPRKYAKTILVVGGRTEPNREPFNFSIAMLRFAELLCQHGNKDAHLAYIRNNVRVIFVPYLEYTTKYLNTYGNFAADGTPTLAQVNVANIVSIMDTIGTIDGVIYQRELNATDIYNATTDDSFVLANQDTNDATNVQSYVDYLNDKGLIAELKKDAASEFANYVYNKRSIKCVRIDTGLDHKMYEKKKYEFDDQYDNVAIAVDKYMKYDGEICHRINNLVNVIKLMSK